MQLVLIVLHHILLFQSVAILMSTPATQALENNSESTPEPFVLITTSTLRSREQEIWSTYPTEIAHRWYLEDDIEKERTDAINKAVLKELSQMKLKHKINSKMGNLYYPSTYQEVKQNFDSPI